MKGLFLSSRKLARDDRGFSLVELIVVIAIMAILAGVGVAGYGKYIEYANKKADVTTVGNILRALDTNTLAITSDLPEQLSSEGIQFPVGFVVLSNKTMTDGAGNTGTALVMQTDKASLVETIEAAYGEDYKNTLKLKSDVWTGASFPSFFDKGEEMSKKVNTLGTGLLSILEFMDTTGLNDYISFSIVADDHDSSADLFVDFADKVVQKDSEKDTETKKSEFLTNWNNAKDNSYDSYGFGLKGREYYSAARASYNSGFSSYVVDQGDAPTGIKDIHGTHDCDAHAASIDSFGQKAGDLVKEEGTEMINSKYPSNGSWADKIANGAASGALIVLQGAINNTGSTKDMILPYTVCNRAFTNTSEGFAFQTCSVCEALYTQYVDSGACAQNGSAFYDTMLTVSEAGREKLNSGVSSDEFFTWMNAQTKAFSDMYNNVQTLTQGKSCIVITVYSKDGLLSYEVAPIIANPRAEAAE